MDDHFLEGVDIDSLQLVVAGLIELFDLPPVLLQDYQLLNLGGGEAAPPQGVTNNSVFESYSNSWTK